MLQRATCDCRERLRPLRIRVERRHQQKVRAAVVFEGFLSLAAEFFDGFDAVGDERG